MLEVDEAKDGAEGLLLLEAPLLRLAFCDIKMPKMGWHGSPAKSEREKYPYAVHYDLGTWHYGDGSGCH